MIDGPPRIRGRCGATPVVRHRAATLSASAAIRTNSAKVPLFSPNGSHALDRSCSTTRNLRTVNVSTFSSRKWARLISRRPTTNWPTASAPMAVAPNAAAPNASANRLALDWPVMSCAIKISIRLNNDGKRIDLRPSRQSACYCRTSSVESENSHMHPPPSRRRRVRRPRNWLAEFEKRLTNKAAHAKPLRYPNSSGREALLALKIHWLHSKD
jgi:hypothetical protein